MLSGIGQAAMGAVERGQAAQRAGANVVRAERERLEGLLEDLRALTLHPEAL
jgi:hypothetical protein